MHASLHARVDLGAQKDPACYPDSLDSLISLIRSNLAEIWACARKHIGCIHASLHGQVDLYTQNNPACYPDSIDTLISLIQPNLAEISAQAHKHIVCMHANLCARVKFCARRGQACSPDSIDILISLIQPIWLRYGPKHARKECARMVACVLACMHMQRHHSHDQHVPLIP